MKVRITREGASVTGVYTRDDSVGIAPSVARPNGRSLSSNASSETSREESLRLAQRLFVAPRPEEPHVVVFCGVATHSGCTRICARTAEMLATQVESKICLLDANFRSPSLSAIFGHEMCDGLAESLVHGTPILEYRQQLAPNNLCLLPAGANRNNVQASLEGMRSRFEQLRKEFEYILVDAPAASVYADLFLWGKLTDGAVFVVAPRSTRRDAAQQVKADFELAGIRLLGAIVNGG